MQKNLNKEIEAYLNDCRSRNVYSPITCNFVHSVLHTLADHFDNPYRNYKELKLRGIADHTIRTYFSYAGGFEQEWLYPTKESKYRAYLHRNRSAFKNCYKRKTKNVKPEVFEKFLSFYLQKKEYRMYNLLILTGRAGLRIAEAVNAKWEDFDDGFLRVLGKGNKLREIPLSKSLLFRLSPDERGPIIPSASFRFFFNRDMRPYTPHDFRAFAATQLLQQGFDIAEIQAVLGHSNLATTALYLRIDKKKLKEKMGVHGTESSQAPER
jgi:integrase